MNRVTESLYQFGLWYCPGLFCLRQRPEHAEADIDLLSDDDILTGDWQTDLLMLAERDAPDVLADLPSMTLIEQWGAYRWLLRRHRERA